MTFVFIKIKKHSYSWNRDTKFSTTKKSLKNFPFLSLKDIFSGCTKVPALERIYWFY